MRVVFLRALEQMRYIGSNDKNIFFGKGGHAVSSVKDAFPLNNCGDLKLWMVMQLAVKMRTFIHLLQQRMIFRFWILNGMAWWSFNLPLAWHVKLNNFWGLERIENGKGSQKELTSYAAAVLFTATTLQHWDDVFQKHLKRKFPAPITVIASSEHHFRIVFR